MISIVFILLFVIVITLISKWTSGRDYYVRKLGPIVTRYVPPQGLTPAQGGYLDDDRFDARDLVATLCDWTAKGYVSMLDNGGTPILSVASRNGHQYFKAFEHTLWDRIFGQGNDFDLDQLSNYGWESKDELFDLVRLALDSGCEERYRPGPRYSWQGRAFTPQGAQLYYQVKCYKQFITSVEVDKLEHLAKSDPSIITQALPRAIVFGCETRFAQLVEHIEIQVGDYQFLHHNNLTFSVFRNIIDLLQTIIRR